MEWKDTAIVLNLNRYSDSLTIVSCLTSKYGVCKGAIKNTKNGRSSSAIGNIVSVSWRGRLEGHLGRFDIMSYESIYPFVYDNKEKMNSIMSLCDLFNTSLAPKEPNKVLYDYLEDFLYSIKYKEKDWLKRLLFIEVELLSHMGFGLDITKCAVSGETIGLEYISPKTGRAISKAIGDPYESKLFKLPKIFQDFTSSYNKDEMLYALKITKYFLEKNITLPESRKNLERSLEGSLV